MASEHASAASPPSAQVVGNAFVHQYYHILHGSPELVHRFYQEGSKLGRPESQGIMSSVTTMQSINEKILSMDYSDVNAEISTVDAQESLDGGVLVLVTGCLTRSDNVKRHFTQSFFLATQDKGYYVLNDMFRYVKDGTESQEGNCGSVNCSDAAPTPELAEAPPREQQEIERTVSQPVEEEANEEEVYNPPENENGFVVEEEVPMDEVIDAAPNNSQAVVANVSHSTIQEEAPKKSYASIVKDRKENATPVSAPTPTPARPAILNVERQATPSPTPVSQENSAANSSAAEANEIQEAEAEGHSVYIKNLPLNATPAQLEEEFKRFGPIKPGGIQVRSHKQQGFCFGFVEFEMATSVQTAIEASPIMIGGRQAYVEEKRPAGSRVSSRGRFLSGRGGIFRNDGGRGRGGYGGGRGYGRGDYNSRSDFGNRSGSRGGSSYRAGGDGGYQRVDHSGSNFDHGNRPGSSTGNASPRNVASQVPAPA
ncbi:nuclear transport factor 2-like isoform X1 [Typha latifolia]|uniref:nuclear transport factor 2-like isoform X1 n=1 Tax=Typha latifolia TaxID=4733 RepID=UPI003C2D05CD